MVLYMACSSRVPHWNARQIVISANGRQWKEMTRRSKTERISTWVRMSPGSIVDPNSSDSPLGTIESTDSLFVSCSKRKWKIKVHRTGRAAAKGPYPRATARHGQISGDLFFILFFSKISTCGRRKSTQLWLSTLQSAMLTSAMLPSATLPALASCSFVDLLPSYLLCSLIKNPEEEDPPRRICTMCFEGGPVPPSSWSGNIVHRKPPWGSFNQSGKREKNNIECKCTKDNPSNLLKIVPDHKHAFCDVRGIWWYPCGAWWWGPIYPQRTQHLGKIC